MSFRGFKDIARLFKDAFLASINNHTPRLGAALAYYTIFAVAPLLLFATSMAGFFFGERAARKELFSQVYGWVGRDGGQVIQSLVAAAHRPKAGVQATMVAALTLGMGATAVFVELQNSLNAIWGVQRKPGGGTLKFIKNRLVSFAMVLGIGFLLLVSLLLDAGLAAIGRFAASSLPERRLYWEIVNFLVSLSIITLLFAMIYKLLPDVKIAWRDVWVGALVTAVLFNLGKFLIGYYLGRSSMVSIYGAAGSFIVLLLWVYYSAQILLYGAEFTHAHAEKRAQSRPPPATPPTPGKV